MKTSQFTDTQLMTWLRYGGTPAWAIRDLLDEIICLREEAGFSRPDNTFSTEDFINRYNGAFQMLPCGIIEEQKETE
jgi:hypothetical protein